VLPAPDAFGSQTVTFTNGSECFDDDADEIRIDLEAAAE
jgi:hypothetical protein